MKNIHYKVTNKFLKDLKKKKQRKKDTKEIEKRSKQV